MSAGQGSSSRIALYGIIMMVGLVFILSLMISIIVNPSDESLTLLFLMILLLASVVITYFWYQKQNYTVQKFEDYSLKK